MNLVEIARGWHAYLSAAPGTRDLIDRRLAVCDGCPNKRALSPFGSLLLSNTLDALYKCALCSCPLEVKAADPKQRCPDTPPRW